MVELAKKVAAFIFLSYVAVIGVMLAFGLVIMFALGVNSLLTG